MAGYEYAHDMLPFGIVLVPIAVMVIFGALELFKRPKR